MTKRFLLIQVDNADLGDLRRFLISEETERQRWELSHVPLPVGLEAQAEALWEDIKSTLSARYGPIPPNKLKFEAEGLE